MEINLKKAETKDIPLLIELDREAQSRTYAAFLTEQEWLDDMAKEPIFFIEADGEIVGVTSYWMKEPDHAYISSLIIRPQFQGKGIARKAMEIVLEWIKDVPLVDLVTHPDNTKAIKLYESLGFKNVARMENHFGDGEPRIKMELRK